MIRVHEVLSADSPDGPAWRVSENDLFGPAFLHVREEPTTQGAHRVWAADYWRWSGEGIGGRRELTVSPRQNAEVSVGKIGWDLFWKEETGMKARLDWGVVVLATVLLAWAASPAMATAWLNHFDNWSGSNLTSVSDYTDTNGQNPRSYTVTYNTGMGGVTQSVPYLYQGDIGSGNKTAAFWNEPGTGSGRIRFATPLPASADLNEGIEVEWSMRVGFTNTGRGPIQIAGTALGDSGSLATPFNAYIRLQNTGGLDGNSHIDIQRNGGGLYKDLSGTNDPLRVDRLTLPTNIGDEFHTWKALVIRNPDENKAYWKLYLDGKQLLFTGPSGSPVWNGQQYSFKTFQEGFGSSGTNDPYIGLGDLNSQDSWEFEFDYVGFTDVPEPGCLALLGLSSLLVVARRRR